MGRAIDMTGKKYNRLTVIGKCEQRDNGHVMWKFKCECGKIIQARGGDVRQGKTMSCGCHNIEQIRITKKTGIKKIDRQK